MNRSEEARSHLRQWEENKPENFYVDDEYLRVALAIHLGTDRLAKAEAALWKAGADSAGPLNRACSLLERLEYTPRLERWSRFGERTEDVIFHPAHHDAGRLVWASGIVSLLGEPGNVLLHSALAYLFAMNGEGSQLCAVGCTAGLVKAIQRCGGEWMRRDWLPRLLDHNYDRRWHAAQLLTEVQGGSDVGANVATARRIAGDEWRLSGEKWFCSNVSADLYAVTARPEGATDGTTGLALFVVPRALGNGQPNNVFIRRLKNKLGTRSLATAEVDFQDAVAYQLGDLDEGFKVMIGVITNTLRLGVGYVSCGIMRRAYVEALHYAHVRTAFGRRLIEFAAVRQQLAEMRALGIAGLAFTFFVAGLEDRLVLAGVSPEDDALFRSAANINKYICSTDAALVAHYGVELLGGNGTIEDFSVLPRLYREMPVHETWEGTHNTLMAQILRDGRRSKLHEALFSTVRDLILTGRHPALKALREQALVSIEDARERFERLLRGNPEVAALHIRKLVCQIARIVQASLLLADADHDAAAAQFVCLSATAQFLLNSATSRGYEPMEDDQYPGLISQILGLS